MFHFNDKVKPRLMRKCKQNGESHGLAITFTQEE